ncbi:MAG: AAA family ATPase [Actinomycetia bacterium]|nr:AAA family ATPase [Actinomycetes bacterium]
MGTGEDSVGRRVNRGRSKQAASTQDEASAQGRMNDLGDAQVLAGRADVALTRESERIRRLWRLVAGLGAVAAWMGWRLAIGNPVQPGLPHLDPIYFIVAAVLTVLMIVLLGPMIAAGRSPHVTYRGEELGLTLDDVRGADVVKEEVVRTLNLFLAHKTFRESMGGNARRAILFEGPPGTGKTYMAKAMAAEAGVPFMFVSSSAFQTMYYGATNKKIRNYFKALRKAARQEGGAIGFIEELDAIGAARTGMGGSGGSEGIAGVVNELLIQLQSFDEPTRAQKALGSGISMVNRFLPGKVQIPKPKPAPANVLIVGATNRAADLDAALLRPGRFDRSVYFGLPSRAERRDIIDYYLDKKAHVPDLDTEARRSAMAATTFGYSPVMLEHLLDEALVWAIRRGADRLDWNDIQSAKLTEELGLKQPVAYTDHERGLIATHESGHAAVAYLVGQDGPGGQKASLIRQLDVLSIVKRRDALGLLAHSDNEERYLRGRAELLATIKIALGGLVAEQIWFGETTSGPSADLHQATTVAAQMVGSYGMTGSLISFDAATMAGAGNVVAKVLSDEVSRERVENLLDEAREEVAIMLSSNRHVVEALRDALLDRDELVSDEILDVIAAAEADTVVDLRERIDLGEPTVDIVDDQDSTTR